MTRSSVARCGVAVLVLATAAEGQSPPWQPVIAVGREVRVHSEMFESPVTGEWRGVERDSARVSLGGGAQIAIPTVTVARIEENLGRQRARGALVGALGGMLVGGVAVALSVGKDDDLAAAAGFAAGAFAGLVFGAPIGFLWAPHRWTTHVNPSR